MEKELQIMMVIGNSRWRHLEGACVFAWPGMGVAHTAKSR